MRRRRRLSREDFLKTLDAIRQDGPKVEYKNPRQMEKPLTYSKEPWLFKLQSLACGELWNSICPEDRFFNAHEKKGN
jgi:hypothetical protein